MKLVVFGPFKRLGAVVESGNIVDLNLAYAQMLKEKGSSRPEVHAAAELPSNLLDFIEEGGAALEAAGKAMEYALAKKAGLVFNPDGVKIWAPLPGLNNKIICAGSNFADHGAGMIATLEGRSATREDIEQIMTEVKQGKHRQWGFWKLAQCVIGPGEQMIYPSRTKYLDYEVELAAVIGKKGKNIQEKDGMDYIFGYTGFNDWSIRYELAGGTPADFVLFKNYDTSASMGPCIVTRDEIPDPYNLKLKLWLNGELRQDAATDLMMRRFPEWIAYISRNFTLNPGDVFASGTCCGTAMDTTPKPEKGPAPIDRFVKVGDVIEFSVERIGSMKNTVIAES